MRAGNWELADRHGADCVDLHTQLGTLIPPHEFPAALIAAHRGRVNEARARARAAVVRAESEGLRIAESGHRWVLGFIELSLGDASAALAHLRRSHELPDAFALEPGRRPWVGDLLEALITVGELDEAEEVLATWEERARKLDRAWALAILARCRGLLLAARGDLEGAFASFERRSPSMPAARIPSTTRARCSPSGEHNGAPRSEAPPARTLEDALARFERLGAPLWADQTRAELARIGGRTPSGAELTEGEQRIAALVAEGSTNREVAAALFLTVHSVETALTRVYRKLGVRSRAELAHLLAAKT